MSGDRRQRGSRQVLRKGRLERAMNYQEARTYLDALSGRGSVLGLENMKELLKRLDNPQKRLRFIHIAGTNGKGSVLAYLSSILQAADYRTGSYTSPHLFSYLERYRINGEDISEELFARMFTTVAAAAESMEQEGLTGPTCFEVETATAMLCFAEQKCDVVVLETGLGGRLDATNVVDSTILAVIASISMDHMDYLGNTLAEIAAQKAGILKAGAAVVSAAQEPEAAEVIAATCAERGCALRCVDSARIHPLSCRIEEQRFDYGTWKNVQIRLAGAYQFKNAALALEAVETLRGLGFTLPDDRVYEGMRNTVWRGRFTPIAEKPTIILDGAHNEAAAIELKKSLELYFRGRELYFVFGVFRDKEYKKIIALTAPMAQHIIAVETVGNPRALPAEELRAAVAEVNPSVEAAGSVREAIHRLCTSVPPEAVIVIFGSLSFLSEAEAAVAEEFGFDKAEQ